MPRGLSITDVPQKAVSRGVPDAVAVAGDWIGFYNTRRPHQVRRARARPGACARGLSGSALPSYGGIRVQTTVLLMLVPSARVTCQVMVRGCPGCDGSAGGGGGVVSTA
jgi:hypothetical protein